MLYVVLCILAIFRPFGVKAPGRGSVFKERVWILGDGRCGANVIRKAVYDGADRQPGIKSKGIGHHLNGSGGIKLGTADAGCKCPIFIHVPYPIQEIAVKYLSAALKCILAFILKKRKQVFLAARA